MENSVLVIGGTGDIGKCISKKYTDFKVISVGSKSLDLKSTQSIDSFFLKYRDFSFKYFIFVSGINNPSKIGKSKANNFTETMQINCSSLEYIFNRNFECLKALKSFVAIGSLYSHISRKNRSAYSCSKHALYGLVKSLCIDYGSECNFNLVSPGFIDTKLTLKNNSQNKLKKIVKMIPLKRLGMCKDIANAVYFLTSDEASYISGTNLTVDGGFMSGGFQKILDE